MQCVCSLSMPFSLLSFILYLHSPSSSYIVIISHYYFCCWCKKWWLLLVCHHFYHWCINSDDIVIIIMWVFRVRQKRWKQWNYAITKPVLVQGKMLMKKIIDAQKQRAVQSLHTEDFQRKAAEQRMRECRAGASPKNLFISFSFICITHSY